MTGTASTHAAEHWIERAKEAWETARKTRDAETKLELEMFACLYEQLGWEARSAAIVRGAPSQASTIPMEAYTAAAR